jgi:hypothetical protein
MNRNLKANEPRNERRSNEDNRLCVACPPEVFAEKVTVRLVFSMSYKARVKQNNISAPYTLL